MNIAIDNSIAFRNRKSGIALIREMQMAGKAVSVSREASVAVDNSIGKKFVKVQKSVTRRLLEWTLLPQIFKKTKRGQVVVFAQDAVDDFYNGLEKRLAIVNE
jgi:hypothetical protein